MKSNREIRAEARKTLRGAWLWRVVTVVSVLQLLGQLVSRFIGEAYSDNGITTWTAFAQSKVEAFRSGLDYCVPSTEAALRMTGASAFEAFIIYIFSAIIAYGIAVVSIKASKDDGNRWFAESMEGIKRPLSLAWFLWVMNLRVVLWSLLFVIPGIIALYRYRLAWYIKAEQPERSVSECLKESGIKMNGFKMQAVALDVSFWLWFMLIGMMFVVALVYPFLNVILMIGLIYVMAYFFTSRAIFYREVCQLA